VKSILNKDLALKAKDQGQGQQHWGYARPSDVQGLAGAENQRWKQACLQDQDQQFSCSIKMLQRIMLYNAHV